MLEQRTAILRLLGDDDPLTLGLVKTQLALHGPANLPELQQLLTGAEPRAARQLREIIFEIERNHADQIFAELCASFGEHGDLETAAWRLAATFDPENNFRQQRTLLDAWGAEVGRRLKKAGSELDRIETLVEFLAHDIGLQGATRDYYRIENSLLPLVVETRRGIPIALSLVYMLVARRAGLELQGIALPTHFLVRSGPYFFDPFNGGRAISIEECKELLEVQQLTLRPAHLDQASPRQMLVRMLANLCNIARENDPPLASKLSSWSELLAK